MDGSSKKTIEILNKLDKAVQISLRSQDVASSTLYEYWREDDFKKLIFHDLRILGGAFSVLETVSKEALLLFRKSENHNLDVIKSDFFWFPYEAVFYSKEHVRAAIDSQFITTRKSQKLDEKAPDFLRFLFLPACRGEEYAFYELTDNNKYNFHGFPILYCDSSEILIFLLCYIELANQLKENDADIDYPDNSIEVLTKTNGEITIETILKDKDYDNFRTEQNYENLYEKFGLIKEGLQTPLCTLLFKRIINSGLFGLSENNDFQYSLNNDFISPAPSSFLSKLTKHILNYYFDDPSKLVYQNSIARIHHYARFPIIPYLGLYLKRKPGISKFGIAHLVIPLWKSYIFPPSIKLLDEETEDINDVVYALLTIDDEYYNKNFETRFWRLLRIIKELGNMTADTVFYQHFANKNIRIEAFRAIISQVLLRNNSHNLGSHISYRATNKEIKKRAIEILSEPNDNDKRRKEINKIINDEEFISWLDYFSEKLDKYVIYRNEYLSDLDLSPKSLMFYEDLVLPFCENMFILDNIAAGEQLNYENNGVKNRIKIECIINGKRMWAKYPKLQKMETLDDIQKAETIVYPNNFPYLLEKKEKDENDEIIDSFSSAINDREILGEENAVDVEICLNSEQAFYSLLENFIRNCAKHGIRHEDEKDLTITLDLKKVESHYELNIYDNNSEATATKLNEIRKRIRKSLLSQDGKPLRENWGFADMKINSFLLFNNFEKIGDDELKENFKLICKKTPNSQNFISCEKLLNSENLDNKIKYKFGYNIKLSLPKKILWIGEIDEHTRAKLEKEGLEHIGTLSDESLQKVARNRKGLTSFQFAIVNLEFDQTAYDEYLKIQTQLPGRVIVLNCEKSLLVKPSILITDKNIPTPFQKDISKMLKWCWQTWLSRHGKDIDLYLYFENKGVAEKWSEVNSKLGKNINLNIINNLSNHDLRWENTKNVVYDHHGTGFDKEYEGVECLNKDIVEVLSFFEDHSIICFGGGSEDFSSLNYPPNNIIDKELSLFQRIDAATTNVFIIDERISDYASNIISNKFQPQGFIPGSAELQIKNWSMYAAGKVFVIHEIRNGEYICKVGEEIKNDIFALDISQEKPGLVSEIKNFDKVDETLQKDILIVHRTYLNEERIGMNPTDFLMKVSKSFGSVFITSGGGYPHNLEGNWRFLPFSILQSCVNSQLAKNKLNNVLRTNLI